jgi:axial budding pattern protein 2
MAPLSKTYPVAKADGVRITDLTAYTPKQQQGLLTEVKRIEKKTFPSSEAIDFETELKKRNTKVVLAVIGDGQSIEAVGYLLYLRMKRIVLLHKICVSQAHRQRGIGKALISSLRSRQENEGADCIQLWVDEDRAPARALYASLGFGQVDRCIDYYGPGRTGLKMLLKLE